VIALDTNVIVRFIVRDDEDQFHRANEFISSRIEEGETFLLPDVVLAELVWVLGGSYNLSRSEIAEVLTSLLMASHLAFPSEDRLSRAVRRYESGRADFADYLIAEQARDFGCEAVASFDKALLSEEGFLEP
jgi:predicted nucleic-acid-binding protein